jgi:hypothetical protein
MDKDRTNEDERKYWTTNEECSFLFPFPKKINLYAQFLFYFFSLGLPLSFNDKAELDERWAGKSFLRHLSVAACTR